RLGPVGAAAGRDRGNGVLTGIADRVAVVLGLALVRRVGRGGEGDRRGDVGDVDRLRGGVAGVGVGVGEAGRHVGVGGAVRGVAGKAAARAAAVGAERVGAADEAAAAAAVG